MMCYARFVMLRGRCSCAISSRPTPSPTHESPLSPLFPLLPGNSPVTPLFPLLTQKQGGGGVSLFALCSPFFSARRLPRPHRRARRLSRSGRDGESSSRRLLFLATRLPSLPRASRQAIPAKGHSPLTPIIPAPLATAALRVVPAPIFTTTSRIHVGAPTILQRQTTKDGPRAPRLPGPVGVNARTGPTQEGGTQEPV